MDDLDLLEHHQTLEVQYQNHLQVLYLLAQLHLLAPMVLALVPQAVPTIVR
jgi:hypothetical protein